jgi:hypothetical protein
MKAMLLEAGGLLRGPTLGISSPARPGATTVRRAVLLLLGSLLYGGVMGSFGGVSGDRLWQVMFSAVKVPLLLGVVFLLSLPSFFVLNTLLGVRSDVPDVLRALVTAQAGLAVILASLAPYTALWYASSGSYQGALLFNGVMFAVASGAAQVLLRRCYRPLIARHRAHRWLLRIWLVLYVFVGIQMAWVLRPFVGSPGVPVRFFREEAWGNAYVVLANLIRDTLFR